MAKKSYGQHFLRDESVIAKILEAADIKGNDAVIEVGPGQGALTVPLWQRMQECGAKDLTLIEADSDLILSLRKAFPEVAILRADATTMDYEQLIGGRSWVFVSNLPYNVGTPILMRILTLPRPPRVGVVMLQKEVGEALLAKVKFSILSVAGQLYGDFSRVVNVKPGSFAPPPKVDSIVLRFVPKAAPAGVDREAVMKLVRVGFAHPRKQVRNNFTHAGFEAAAVEAALSAVQLSASVRAEDIPVATWIQLAAVLNTSL
ncbi:ribosomal RNA small subunit methyltransferase A [Patescibacteria group bacterium]|nr:ribosomal RNA small subunit methyltransferase A [Patescibacteria group bacterium]